MIPHMKIPLLGASLALGLWLSPISLNAGEGHEHEASPAVEEHEERMGAEESAHGHEMEAEAEGHGHDEMPGHDAMGGEAHMDDDRLEIDDGLAQAKWCRETLLEGKLMLDETQIQRCMSLVSRHEGAGGNVIVVRMTASADNTVNRFNPARVEIRRGDTVRWVMDSGPVHNAVAYPNRIPYTALPFEGPLLTKVGDAWSQTFFFPGTYEYHCHPHEALGMRGVVIVERESRPDEFRKMRGGDEAAHAHH